MLIIRIAINGLVVGERIEIWRAHCNILVAVYLRSVHGRITRIQ